MTHIKRCAVLIGSLLAMEAIGGATCGFAEAQSVVPNGANTAVTNINGDFEITGGTLSNDGENLFHSFEQFGLSASEAANFITQPNVLNVVGRINGGNPSVINGQLRLTGSEANLFLLNPVGVFFGPDATLALPGDLSVSTADGLAFADDTLEVIGTPDYASLVGSPTGLVFRFSTPGSVVNVADLTLGADSALTLAGGTVVSTGTVSAGEVAIASVPGEQLIRLNPEGSILGYDIAPTGNDRLLSPLTLPELLTGAGDLAPGEGASGEGVSGEGVSGEGANRLQLDDDGTVRLVNSDLTIPNTPGTTIVNGDLTAGEITLLGDTVGVVSSLLNASSPNGGGTISIGGSYQGQGSLPNAKTTYISADSVLDASATANGNGGEIIVWSDQTTNALGQFLALGGPNGGDGGLIETSGLQGLTLGTIAPDVSAPAGSAGLWLIDPFNVVIGEFETTEFSEGDAFVPLSSPAQLNVGLILAALESGNVTVTTGTDGNEEGNITLLSPVFYQTDPAATTSLNLEAAGSILINANIGPDTSVGGPLDINLLADVDGTGNGQVVIGDVASGIVVNVDTNGGNLVATGNSTNLTGVTDTSAVILGDNSGLSAVSFDFLNQGNEKWLYHPEWCC